MRNHFICVLTQKLVPRMNIYQLQSQILNAFDHGLPLWPRVELMRSDPLDQHRYLDFAQLAAGVLTGRDSRVESNYFFEDFGPGGSHAESRGSTPVIAN